MSRQPRPAFERREDLRATVIQVSIVLLVVLAVWLAWVIR